MRGRDVAIILLCVLGMLVSYQQEGALSIRRGFMIPVYDEATKQRAMPPPIITDIDGDGKNEVLFLKGRHTLALVSASQLRRSSHMDFTHLRPRLEVNLPSNCIGFATGYTEPYNETSPVARKQVIVAVTDDYSVTQFDGQLTRLWTVVIPDQSETTFVPQHASVLILPHAIHKGDQGVVIIGVDTFNPNAAEVKPDTTPAQMVQPVQVHFSYYALNALFGDLRWKHDATSFHDDTATRTYPQQSYKLTAQHLEHHSGEQDWRVYRRSMLATLPHSYGHSHDIKLRVHHFAKKLAAKRTDANTRKAQTQAVPTAQVAKKPSSDNFGELGDRISGISGLVKERLSKPHSHEDHLKHPNVIVAHLEQGIEVLHLYTGRTLCQFGPLLPGHVYDDVNGDTSIDTVSATIVSGDTAIRSRSKAGKRQGNLCLGTVSSGSPGMMIDKLWNGSICINGGVLRQFETLKYLLRQGEHQSEEEEEEDPEGLNSNPWGAVDHFTENTRAALPIVLHRRVHEVQGLQKLQTLALFYINSGLVTCVEPASGKIKWQVETESTFRGADLGLAEGVGENLDDSSGISLRGTTPHDHDLVVSHYPHLLPFSVPSTHASVKHRQVKSERSIASTKDKPYVLVVGDNVLTALNTANGKTEAHIELDEAALAPVVIGDLNSDGTNDIIVMSKNAYYGFLTYQQGNTSVLTFLMLTMIGMIGLLFISQRMVQLSDPYYEPTFTANKRATD
eukprot:TRINITY_DN93285_c0_g1_i1.p1 TRINITY_DN93285_c0_g1~~TRINITY_DN93285_c0_g1_i1.p1  ORF type:complete len:732 (-),score=88.92 TRINITY_DN93285_c0_g1_i1:2221-4416(-)